jgi:HD-GYP domain-containing protein (c-di-GMP phosphodiesterase class II)
MVRMSQLVRATDAAAPTQKPPAPDTSAHRRDPENGHSNVTAMHFPKTHEESAQTVAEPSANAWRASPSEKKEDSEALYREIVEFLGHIPLVIREGRPLPWTAYQALVDRTIANLKGGADLLWIANDPYPQGANYLVSHIASVGILSIRIGIGLDYDQPRLHELGLAAFLFDVGMWRVPEAVLKKTSALTPDELAVIQNHTRLGAELVGQWTSANPELLEPILQHHERENGHGYPQGLAGTLIHPNARIIGLMDVYAALIQQRPYRRRFRCHEAIRDIVKTKHDNFSPQLIKALLAEVSFFPPPTLVKLNTGEIGRVVSVNRQQPLRPELEILVDSRGNRLDPPKPLDLAEAPFVYVVGPLHEGELKVSPDPLA